MEVIVKAYLFTASSLNCALSVTESIALANNLIGGLEMPNNSSFGKSNVAFIVKKPKFWEEGGGVYSKSPILML